jgi:hypothetical protein
MPNMFTRAIARVTGTADRSPVKLTGNIKRYLNVLKANEAQRVMSRPMRGYAGGPGNDSGEYPNARQCLIHTAQVTGERNGVHAYAAARDFDALTRRHGARAVCSAIRGFLSERGRVTAERERVRLENALREHAGASNAVPRDPTNLDQSHDLNARKETAINELLNSLDSNAREMAEQV